MSTHSYSSDRLLSWLRQFQDVYLVPHNGRCFDFPVVLATCVATATHEDLCSSVRGFVDSIPVFKIVFPKRDSYKPEDLVRNLLEKEYNAHNQLTMLSVCLSFYLLYWLVITSAFLQKSFKPLDVKHSLELNKEKRKNSPSLSPLITSGVRKTETAENVASSGLDLKHLKTIFTGNGEDGLYNVFIMKNSEGLPRVTSVKRALESVMPKLAAYFENKEK